jgi:integrase
MAATQQRIKTKGRKAQRRAGIEVRHSTWCPASTGGSRCTCSPTYRAEVYSSRERRKLRRSFDTLAEAEAWRREAKTALDRGTLRAAATPTLGKLVEDWVKGARVGTVRNRSGDVYKPSTIRSYEEAFRLRVQPVLGATRLTELTSADLQQLVDDLLEAGCNASTVRNTLMPIRAVCRRAIARGDIALNPTRGLELPAVRGERDRIASPQEAAKLLAALTQDRALWATALYAGLRRGELLALKWDCVDFRRETIEVRRGWDAKEGIIEPKSRAGRRFVPMSNTLRRFLEEHRRACPWQDGLVFGHTGDRPFAPGTLTKRARKAWRAADLTPITLHECRHTFASLMIAAGVNAHAIKVYMGHSTIAFTFDRYGHLMPGNGAQAAQLLDAYVQ